MAETYVVGTNGKPTIFKDPNATLDYSLDWTAWLGADTIASILVTPETGITVGSSSFLLGVVTAFVSGGTAGTTYSLAFRITTTQGRIDERTIYLKIKDR